MKNRRIRSAVFFRPAFAECRASRHRSTFPVAAPQHRKVLTDLNASNTLISNDRLNVL
jgi:two-component SAPR family response regulator